MAPHTSEKKPVDESARLAGAIALVNTEKQLIWQRYTTMLVVNGIVVGFLSSSASQDTVTKLWVSCGGLLLSAFWFLLNREGWKYFRFYQQCVSDLWDQDQTTVVPNPFKPDLIDFSPQKKDVPVRPWWTINKLADAVVLLFVVSYTILILGYINSLFLYGLLSPSMRQAPGECVVCHRDALYIPHHAHHPWAWLCHP